MAASRLQDQYELVPRHERLSFERHHDQNSSAGYSQSEEVENHHNNMESEDVERDSGNNPLPSTARTSQENLKGLRPVSSTASRRQRLRLPLYWTDWWTLEVAAAILSILCTVAIIVVLAWINGKPIESWHWTIQPNTIVSILSTVAKSALLLPVAECISQQKWQYYQSQRPRKLEKLEIFDRASRGPYGAIQILFSIKTFAAILGALVTLTALGVDPFVQQVIAFQQDQIPLDHSVALTSYSQLYDTGRSGSGGVAPAEVFPTTNNSPVELQAGFYAGLYATPLKVVPTCSTPTCDWDPYMSLGLCSKCNDVSSSTKQTCTQTSGMNTGWTCNFTTPANYKLNATALSAPHNTKATLFNSVAYSSVNLGKNGLPALLNQLILFAAVSIPAVNYETPPGKNAKVYECALNFCGKTYTGVNVRNGTYTEPPPTEWDFTSQQVWREESIDMVWTNLIPPSNIHGVNSSNGNWTVNGLDWEDTSNYLAQAFTSPSDAQADLIYAGAAPNQAISAQLHSNDIPTTMQNIATSMTNAIRNSQKKATFKGTATQAQTKIVVRWPWIILPVAVVVGGNLLLVLSIVESSRRQTPLWRSSSLALMFHGLKGVGDYPAEKTSEMESSAKELKVRLMGSSGQEMRFVGS
ncbi:hypothetical protein BT63DRAFT_211058 [Microthyrium microscopicum]|uniref:DUF3176 domain-containing protein n=1 Tax=Microthyrium microscopicum TaxID=703497 RepID=A0A6A6UJJ8_9PEZI|nr:hypothetical protein BT63DRAFT_211058 [Microthyrium microscopicum]